MNNPWCVYNVDTLEVYITAPTLEFAQEMLWSIKNEWIGEQYKTMNLAISNDFPWDWQN